MIYIVEIERKIDKVRVHRCTIRRVDTLKGEYLMPRSFEGETGWMFMDYTTKIQDYIELDRPKQIIFETFGLSGGLYDVFMNTHHDKYTISANGDILYVESKTA